MKSWAASLFCPLAREAGEGWGEGAESARHPLGSTPIPAFPRVAGVRS
jgi:hypothetical protein